MRRLRTFIWFLFLKQRVLEFLPSNLEYFKSGSKRIADAKRSGYYGKERDQRLSEIDDDEGYDSECEAPAKKAAGVKRVDE